MSPASNTQETMAPPASWQAWCDAIVHYLQPRHLAVTLGLPAEAATVADVIERRRFAARIRALVQAEHGLVAPADLPIPASDDLPAIVLAPDAGPRLVHDCGAIALGRALAQEVRAPQVAALREALGEQAYALALKHRELAAPAEVSIADPGALTPIIQRYGRAAIRAWAATLDEPLARWLALGWLGPVYEQMGDTSSPSAAIDGVAIVRAASVALHAQARSADNPEVGDVVGA